MARVLGLAIILILSSTHLLPRQAHAVGEPPCIPKFQTLGQEGAKWASDLDRLVAFETEIDKAESLIRDKIKTLGLQPKDSFRIANEKHIEVMGIRLQYDTLADDLLSEDLKRIGDLEGRIEGLRTRLHSTLDVSNTSKAASGGSSEISFKDLIEAPGKIKAETKYEVPQAAGVAGSTSAKKLSVSFTREVLDYFNVDIERGARFLRAIQKGYIGSGSGSGIVRITDHHEALVEIKVIGGKEGNQRLVGCRRADGFIEILKVYEKRNEGGGGSLKHFAELCE